MLKLLVILVCQTQAGQFQYPHYIHPPAHILYTCPHPDSVEGVFPDMESGCQHYFICRGGTVDTYYLFKQRLYPSFLGMEVLLWPRSPV